MNDQALERLGGSNPVPTLSAKSISHMVSRLKAAKFDYVVEYGSGASTRYWLRLMMEIGRKAELISVEYDRGWFHQVVTAVKQDWQDALLSEEHLHLSPWPIAKIKRFLNGPSLTSLDIPTDLRRLPRMKGRLKARAGRLGLARFLVDKAARPRDGYFTMAIDDTLRFTLNLRTEMDKDQYGESPVKHEYIRAGLESIEQDLQSSTAPIRAAFLIDGGPRADVADAILDLEEKYDKFCPAIFLWDTQRTIYHQPTHRRKTGYFFDGSNAKPDGTPFNADFAGDPAKGRFWHGKSSLTSEEMVRNEMWVYERQSGHLVSAQ